MAHRRLRAWHLWLALLLIFLVGEGLAAFGGWVSPYLSLDALGPPSRLAAVDFAPAVSYTQALRTITDLGLALAEPCVNLDGDWAAAGATYSSADQWNAELAVQPSEVSAPDWLWRLRRASDVARVTTNPVYHCALDATATKVPGGRYYLTAAQAGTLVRVTFTADTTYADALAGVLALGFQLADPCYSHPPRGAAVAWSPMGQEDAYARTHAFLVTTTRFNSTLWQEQLETETLGVAGMQLRPAVACPPG